MRWLFIDRILDFKPWEHIGVLKLGTLEEYFLLERWGEPAKSPGLILLESAIQAADWLVEASSDFSLTFSLKELYDFKSLRGLGPAEGLVWFIRVAAAEKSHLELVAQSYRCSEATDVLEGLGRLKKTFRSYSRTDESLKAPSVEVFRFSGETVFLSGLKMRDHRRAWWRELSGGIEP
ncbi:MAG: hypothetical protein LBP22_13815 [Deltaproteobacteria bacterium]|nr:hypothetical protein [Deltaproteobacteria bacterium]